MKTVAVLGGGPAGATAAERLARSGFERLFSTKNWLGKSPAAAALPTKPIPISLSFRQRYSQENCHRHDAGGAQIRRVQMRLTRPLVIYSRIDLNGMLLRRAEAAGAEIEKTRVLGLERGRDSWRIRTRFGQHRCRLLRHRNRRAQSVARRGDAIHRARHHVCARLLGAERSSAYRYSISAQFRRLHLGFPARRHLRWHLRQKRIGAMPARSLERYMDEKGMSPQGCQILRPHAARSESRGWRIIALAGDGWIAVGDAGGLVDPLPAKGSTTQCVPAIWQARFC